MSLYRKFDFCSVVTNAFLSAGRMLKGEKPTERHYLYKCQGFLSQVQTPFV